MNRMYLLLLMLLFSVTASAQIPSYCPAPEEFQVVTGSNFLTFTPPVVPTWRVSIQQNYQVNGDVITITVLSFYDLNPVNSFPLNIPGLAAGAYTVNFVRYYSPPSGFPPAGIPCPPVSRTYIVGGSLAPVPVGNVIGWSLLGVLLTGLALCAKRRSGLSVAE